MNHSPKRKFDAPSVDTIAPQEIAAWAKRRSTENKARRAAEARAASAPPRASEPTTCGGALTDAEIELMQAMKEYKESSGRMFPTWSEVLEVIQGLGYQKRAEA